MNLHAELPRVKRYIGRLFLITVISVALIGAGSYLGGIIVADRLFLEGASVPTILRMAGPGITLQSLGVLVWSIGTVATRYTVFYEQFSATMERDLTSDDLKASLKNTVGNRVDDLQQEFDEIRRQLEQRDRNRDS